MDGNNGEDRRAGAPRCSRGGSDSCRPTGAALFGRLSILPVGGEDHRQARSRPAIGFPSACRPGSRSSPRCGSREQTDEIVVDGPPRRDARLWREGRGHCAPHRDPSDTAARPRAWCNRTVPPDRCTRQVRRSTPWASEPLRAGRSCAATLSVMQSSEVYGGSSDWRCGS
jgi:hypothetical protein